MKQTAEFYTVLCDAMLCTIFFLLRDLIFLVLPGYYSSEASFYIFVLPLVSQCNLSLAVWSF